MGVVQMKIVGFRFSDIGSHFMLRKNEVWVGEFFDELGEVFDEVVERRSISGPSFDCRGFFSPAGDEYVWELGPYFAHSLLSF